LRVETEPTERRFDLRQYLNFVWRHWMFIASVTALLFLIAVVYLARATPLYTATTQVLSNALKAPTIRSTDYRFNDFSFIETSWQSSIRPAAAKVGHERPRPTDAKEPQSTALQRAGIGGRPVRSMP
jgi:hypothetical protein